MCLGYPGSMPVINEEAIRLTVITGLMIGSRISDYSKFDRKNYFYPDMPKNYQISQYDKPLCVGGSVEIELEGGKKTIGVTRIHLEEDVGKNMHFENSSGIDFNRAGMPLMEIVSEPDLESPEEAFAYLLALKQILLYGGVSDCNLEQGNMRCDVNCSVRPAGQQEFGTKTEIKNMNTFKGVLRALKYEIARQIAELEKGGKIVQETRRWDADAGVTFAMRSKEYAHDYRYFPEPDLMPVVLSPRASRAVARRAARAAGQAPGAAGLRNTGCRNTMRACSWPTRRWRITSRRSRALRQCQGGVQLDHDRDAAVSVREGNGDRQGAASRRRRWPT